MMKNAGSYSMNSVRFAGCTSNPKFLTPREIVSTSEPVAAVCVYSLTGALLNNVLSVDASILSTPDAVGWHC